MDHLHWRSFFSETICDSDTQTVMWRSLLYLSWPPWAAQCKIELILSISCCPRWPRQVQSRVAVTGIIMSTFANGNNGLYTFSSYKTVCGGSTVVGLHFWIDILSHTGLYFGLHFSLHTFQYVGLIFLVKFLAAYLATHWATFLAAYLAEHSEHLN